MSAPLSPIVLDALKRCVAAGGLVYVVGGWWVERGGSERVWSCTTHTIKALRSRDLVSVLSTEARSGYVTAFEATPAGKAAAS